MLNIKTIREIIDLALDKEVLNKIDFQSLNFSEKDIDELISKGIIRKQKGDSYVISCQEKIYHYGVDLYYRCQFDSAVKCFKKCIELKPTNRDAYLQLMLLYIERRKYQEAYNVYDNIVQLNDKSCIKDDNFILYLMSLVSNYPDKYKTRITTMEYEDILIKESDGKYPKIQDQNKIRIRVFQNKYHQASTILKFSTPEDFPNKIEKRIIQVLLSRTIETNDQQVEYIIYLTQGKDYARIVSLLENKRQKRNLSLTETYILFIAKNLVWISENRKIPKVKVTDATNLKDALKGNNFALALKINREYTTTCPDDKKHVSNDNKIKTVITPLLIEINKLIKEVIEEKKEQFKKELESFDLQRIEEIAAYLKQEKIGINDACTKLNLTKEDILLIKLIYVIDYYTEEEYLLGDQLFKEVELSTDKTTIVLAKLSEIRENRLTYKTKSLKKKLVPLQ